jgi:hypothetical protein
VELDRLGKILAGDVGLGEPGAGGRRKRRGTAPRGCDARPRATAAPPSVSSWCCYSLPHGSPVRQDLRSRRIALVTGAPAGLAETALRDLLGLPGTPSWPR